jgi:hypothetical protein
MNVHEACCIAASVALHSTAESPTGKTLPEPGAQLTEYGGSPPVGAGDSKWTSVPSALVTSRVSGRAAHRFGAVGRLHRHPTAGGVLRHRCENHGSGRANSW